MSAEVSVIDCGRGNLRSLAGALDRLGVAHERVTTAEGVRGARRLILPGVGAFGRFMGALRERGLDEAIREAVEKGTPLLGICVGMQVLAERGTEHGDHAGLGLVGGVVDRLTPGDARCRVPHVGWNRVIGERGHAWLPEGDESYYFVHGFALRESARADVIATVEHGGSVVAVVAREHVMGVQFHPEKSQEAGLELLRRYCDAAA